MAALMNLSGFILHMANFPSKLHGRRFIILPKLSRCISISGTKTSLKSCHSSCSVEDKISADSAIQKLGIPLCSACSFCDNSQYETPSHILILLHGERAKEIWHHFSQLLEVNVFNDDTVLTRSIRWASAASLNSTYGYSCMAVSILICWHLWLARNSYRFESTKVSSYAIIHRIMRDWFHLVSLFRAKVMDKSQHKRLLERAGINSAFTHYIEIVYWKKPSQGSLKLNIDGAAKGNPGRSGGGGGVRDSQGNLLFAFFSYFGIRTSFMAELRALVTGLRLCLALGCKPGIVEMDSKIIVELLTNRSHPPWTAHPWWREAISISDRLQVRFIHTYREGNCFADSLANHGVIMEQNRLILQENRATSGS